MKKIINLVFPACALLLAYGLKTYFSQATARELAWILRPTATLVSLTTGINFRMDPELGFVNGGHSLIIAPGCAGGNFMVIALLVVAWAGITTLCTTRKKTTWLLLSPVVAYAATIIINSIRVTLSIWLYRAPIYSGLVTREGIHRIAGVVIYLGGLCLLHLLLERSLNRYQRKLSSRHRYISQKTNLSPSIRQPIFWYILIVIVVPVLNHSGTPLSPLFVEHCFSVALGCALVIALFRLPGPKKNSAHDGAQKRELQYQPEYGKKKKLRINQHGWTRFFPLQPQQTIKVGTKTHARHGYNK
jgi:exosortase K